MYCPGFLLDIVVARVSLEFLHGDAPLESFCEKYSMVFLKNILKSRWTVFYLHPMLSLEFLSEVEAGEQAVDYLSNFTYFKLYLRKLRCRESTSRYLVLFLMVRNRRLFLLMVW